MVLPSLRLSLLPLRLRVSIAHESIHLRFSNPQNISKTDGNGPLKSDQIHQFLHNTETASLAEPELFL